MRLGAIYEIPPEPWRPERTHFVDAGAVRIGIEHRQINNESLKESFADNAANAQALAALLEGQEVSDRGVSLHVCGAADGHEYLRFDCFETDPHYHYNHHVSAGAPPINHVVMYDQSACGDMLPWALERIRNHLKAMLREADGEVVAQQLDSRKLSAAVEELQRLAPRFE